MAASPTIFSMAFVGKDWDIVWMPRMNGFELYNKIKEHDSCVKVCFMTALDELQEYNQYKVEVSPATGKRHFVQKPIRNE